MSFLSAPWQRLAQRLQPIARGLSNSASQAPIGVDFAGERLNMLQMASTAGNPVVQAAVSIPYPCARELLLADPVKLKAFVRGSIASAPFSGRRVYSALSPADVRILPLTLQVAPGQQERQAVAKAVREHVGGPLSEAVVDYYHVRSIDGEGPEKQVLVALAQQPRVLAYLDMLRSAGLEPVSLDIGPAALARLLAAMQAEDYGQSVLLINFGVAKSFLTVVWGRRLMIDREIDFGELQLIDKLARSLALTPEIARALLHEHGIGAREQGRRDTGVAELDVGRTIREILHPEFAVLSEELTRTQVYVASRTRGSSISRVYLNGSAARYPNIQIRIQELIGLPVEILNPFNAFATVASVVSGASVSPVTPAGGELMQGIALAAGLALRGRADG